MVAINRARVDGDSRSLIGTDSSGNARLNSFGRVGCQAVRLGDFNATVTFQISRSGNNCHPAGEGLVFFIVPAGHRFPPKPVGPKGLGVFDPDSGRGEHVFAVSFKLIAGGVAGEVNAQLGIHNQSNEPVTPPVYISVDVIGKDIALSIQYVASSRTITATATVDTDPFPHAPYPVDLSRIVGSPVEFGVAASTSADRAAFFEVTSPVDWQAGAGGI